MLEFNIDTISMNVYCEQIKAILKRNFGYEEPTFYRSENDYEYKKRDMSKRREIIYLSSGECLKYEIPKFTLAHLLGIDTEYLIRNNFVKADNSYDALIEFIETPERIKNKYHIDYSKFVSPFIRTKINSLIDNLYCNLETCEFICKFDISRSYGYNNDNDMDYFIVTRPENSKKYNLLILKKTQNKNTEEIIYVPQSNQSFDSEERLLEYLSDKVVNQEFTIMVSKQYKNSVYDQWRKVWINPKTRLQKLEGLKKWCKNLTSTPNVLNDYIYSLGILSKEKNRNAVASSYLESIEDSIKNGVYVKIDYDAGLTEELIRILESYNESLEMNNENENEETYSKVVKRKEDLEKKLIESLQTNEELNAKYNEVNQKYQDALAELETLKGKMKEINKLSE